MTPLAAYLLLFLAVGVGFIFVHLVAGHFIRPSKKNPEKDTIYECGEPTIGSAWIQFDLRFYVVALLFVIFDVEVAFFFPWAEVFGKSNAIRSTPFDPKTATREEVNSFAALVNDLATPRGSTGKPVSPGGPGRLVTSSNLEREYWRKLETLSQEEFDAYRQLQGSMGSSMALLVDPRLRPLISSLTAEQIQGVEKREKALRRAIEAITDEQKKSAKATLDEIDKLPDGKKAELEEAMKPPGGNPKPKPAGKEKGGLYVPPPEEVAVAGLSGLREGLTLRPGEIERFLHRLTLNNLSKVLTESLLLAQVSARQRKAMEKFLPGRIKALDAQAAAQTKSVREAAAAARAGLPAGAELAGLWDDMSLTRLKDLTALSDQGRAALRLLTPEGMAAMEAPLTEGVKQRAGTLSLMALVEILVFFGVLLVGFAYLWKRGDLAWVRSTAAESVGKPT